ncbi:replication protein RepR [Streptococcus agalactiae]|uniref:Replication protein RepR n=1 Tax=Streptococcus agalactiae TaxID=1311 RepID=A0AB74H0Y4_STRAG|nr:replication protein RepR [Streptococcus agalactiae]
MREANIKGDKALMGRNNVLFTLALANFSSGVSQSDCEVVLADFNEHLAEPLSQDEFLKVIYSAIQENMKQPIEIISNYYAKLGLMKI